MPGQTGGETLTQTDVSHSMPPDVRIIDQLRNASKCHGNSKFHSDLSLWDLVTFNKTKTNN